jgi:amino acid adenylation domain-containing protein
LLEELLQKARPAAPQEKRRKSEYEAPLSFAQQRLWFFEQLMPGSVVYNMLMPIPLPFAVDAPILLDAVNEIVARHDVLRATFRSVDGKPVQAIAPGLKLEMPVGDLRGLAPDERESAIARFLNEDALAPYDLANGPLVRVRLLRFGDAEHTLILAMHHITSDAWSVSVFYRELCEIYAAFAAGKPSPLPDLQIQYPDYAVWQRNWLRGETLERQLGYWKKQLEGVAPIELPFDRPRPANMTFRGGYAPVKIEGPLLDRLRALGARHDCTLFMTVLAAFQVLLYRHTGQSDVVVGTAVANRNHGDAEQLIGFFINSLVMRTSLAGNPTFCELLARTRETALGAYAHQDIPFEMLVEHLQPERDFTRNPFFQVLFQLQRAGGSKGEQEIGPPKQLQNAVFDLHAFLNEHPDGLEGRLEYNAALFDDLTIARIVERFGVLLEAIAGNADRPIDELAVLTPAERLQMLVEWLPGPAPLPEIPSIHAWFESQAARTPQVAAVAAAGETVTYEELNRRADRVARALCELGAGRGDRVALQLERSVEIVASILGVLKTGAAYVPIEPDTPEERLRFMLDDCGARAMITAEGLRRLTPAASSAPSLAASPATQPSPIDTAYLIYTSGSTGAPKGVPVPHRCLIYSTWARLQYYEEPVGRYLLLSPFAFDSSVAGIFWTLCSGGCLEIPTRAELADIPELAFRVDRAGVTHLLATPSLYARLLDWFEVSALRLKAAIVAGEACPAALSAYHFERMPHVPLYNEYGPTEATVWSTVYRCEALPSAPGEGRAGAPPIGRPIPNARVYIVGRGEQKNNVQPVPLGVAGELWIGGPGVTPGYWNRPELTAERFVPDPFAGGEAVAYRTGDLAKYLPDGNIVFLGRIDNQVKVRGYRIELGEIEAALLAHPAIAECAAFAWKYEDDTRLAAWLTPSGPRVAAEEIAGFLRQRLPEYMIPASMTWVEELPRNANGKLDRAALAANPERFDAVEYVAPRNPVEKALAGLYAELLGAAPGIHADFFRMGGHSLLATRLLSRVNRAFQIDLPLATVFRASNIAALAAEVEQAVVEQLDGTLENQLEDQSENQETRS